MQLELVPRFSRWSWCLVAPCFYKKWPDFNPAISISTFVQKYADQCDYRGKRDNIPPEDSSKTRSLASVLWALVHVLIIVI